MLSIDSEGVKAEHCDKSSVFRVLPWPFVKASMPSEVTFIHSPNLTHSNRPHFAKAMIERSVISEQYQRLIDRSEEHSLQIAVMPASVMLLQPDTSNIVKFGQKLAIDVRPIVCQTF